MNPVNDHYGRKATERSRRRGRSIVIVASGLAFVGLFLLLKTKEPRFQGKPLSVWLSQLDTKRFNAVDLNPVLNQEAADAVRQIGDSAVPFLIKRLESAFAAERTYYRLQDWPTKLPFKLLESRLDKRTELGAEAIMGFLALGKEVERAVPELNAMVAGREVQSESLFKAMAAAGPASLQIFSNALQSSDFWLRRNATKAAGYLGNAGAPLVPQLISILEQLKQGGTESAFAARSLGKIGEPSGIVVTALRGALLATNDTVAANASVGLMLMGTAGRDAIPDIETRLVKTKGKVNSLMVLFLIVLCTNDDRVFSTLEQLQVLSPLDEKNHKPIGESRRLPIGSLAHVRETWTNCDMQARREMFSTLEELVQEKETN